MNPLLSRLQPYPFERLRQLFADITPSPAHRPISLGIGEPRHATPAFIQQALIEGLGGLSAYPATAGEPRLRQAFADPAYFAGESTLPDTPIFVAAGDGYIIRNFVKWNKDRAYWAAKRQADAERIAAYRSRRTSP